MTEIPKGFQLFFTQILAILICGLVALSSVIAQEPAVADTSLNINIQDTIPPNPDSVATDTSISAFERYDVRYSDEALEAIVDYGAEDSIHFNVLEQKVYLYGQAFVNYQTISLKAGYIAVDLKNNIVTAKPFGDSLGTQLGKPEFEDGDQQFVANWLQYNFRSQKGIVKGTKTQQGDLTVHGERTKFISGKRTDAGAGNDVIYNENALITTCDLDHPHFGILSGKQKVIPNKLVVIGPSVMEIADVPTPLVLPFGFFPVTKGRTAGLIFPRDYEYNDNDGFGLSNVGYYTPVSQYADVEVTFDIFLRGTYRVHVRPNYRKRYKFSGNLQLDYANERLVSASDVVSRRKSFSIRWSHRQEAKAHPYNSLSGSVSIQTNNYQRNNLNDVQNVQQNILRSNMTFTRRFPGSPFTLSTSFEHSQNTNSREVRVKFPNANLQMTQIYPFKKKVGSQDAWYENIVFDYEVRAFNELRATDTTLFTRKTLENAQFGAIHRTSLGLSFKLLKFLNFNPSANYDEAWYFKRISKSFDPTPVIEIDTVFSDNGEILEINRDTTFGTVITDTTGQFNPLRQYNMSVGLNTRMFGTLQFRKGWLRGIRHTLTPRVSFNFRPDYSSSKWGYFETVQTSTQPGESNEETYSIFPRISGLPGPSTSGKQMSMGFGFSNVVEGKFYSKRDSSIKKNILLPALNVNSSYNFAADSLHFADIGANGFFELFKNLTRVRFGGTWSPYEINNSGQKVDRFVWDTRGSVARFVRANVNLQTNLTLEKIQQIFGREKTQATRSRNQEQPEDGLRRSGAGGTEELEKLVNGLSLRHDFAVTWNARRLNGRDTIISNISQNSIYLQIRSIQLSPNWSVQVRQVGYDFLSKTLTYPDFVFSRNLHCWEMGFSFQPNRRTYAFYLRVKPGSLDFIEVPFRKTRPTGFDQGF